MKQDRILPSAEELILCKDPAIVCETYLFEPSDAEEHLGFLFAAGETEDRGGIGKPLLDTVITAIQKEYYRDPSRSASTSFEMALHQANLILYDSVESGIRDWMGHFHVAIGILAGKELHLSVAGAGAVFLARNRSVTNISKGISHFPITDPLKTFSQVASGEVQARDTIFFTSATFDTVFRSVDIGRFSLEHSASTIASRLEQLYLDQGHRVPLSTTVVTLLPQYIAEPKQEQPSAARKQHASAIPPKLQPRVPLIIKRSSIQQVFTAIISIFGYIWTALQQWVWPAVKNTSRGAVKSIPKISVSLPKASPKHAMSWISSLPKSSKIFAGIAVLLLIALGVSIVLLQYKRASDQVIEQASQKLHEARTKVDAAKTALIYDNREQATGLLKDAKALADELQAGTLYTDETKALAQDIQTQQDRLQKIFRTSTANTKTIGDFSSTLNGKTPTHLFFVNNAIYAANPDTNAIGKMELDGKASVAHATSAGIGFITNGSVQSSDKTITFSTDGGGIALFDTKDNTLTSQTIDYPSDKPAIEDLAVFGNRLYIYDTGLKNILSFNKTLRGFSGGSPWITDADAAKTPIKSIAIDGSIYALAQDGKITKFFRGAIADFTQAAVDPSLSSATKIVTNDTMQNLYVLDPANKRVVIYSKKGALLRQLFFEDASSISDIAISADETHLYALDGTKVLEVALVEEAQ